MTAHTQHPVRRAILILLALSTFAWLVFMVADTKTAAPNTETDATIELANQTPGSSLEGINDALLPIIGWYEAAHANTLAAERAAQQKATIVRPPATTTAPVVRSAPTTQCPADIVALIEKHWSRFGADVVQWAIGIAWRESNCRPDVTSPTGCAGLFQTAVPLHAGLYAAAGFDWHTAAWEAEPNIIVAANLYASSGPGPWRL